MSDGLHREPVKLYLWDKEAGRALTKGSYWRFCDLELRQYGPAECETPELHTTAKSAVMELDVTRLPELVRRFAEDAQSFTLRQLRKTPGTVRARTLVRLVSIRAGTLDIRRDTDGHPNIKEPADGDGQAVLLLPSSTARGTEYSEASVRFVTARGRPVISSRWRQGDEV